MAGVCHLEILQVTQRTDILIISTSCTSLYLSRFGVWLCPLIDLFASGKTEASLRLYCRVRFATLYMMLLVEKLIPISWPVPNTATSHGELPSAPHELRSASTVVELGRETVTVL